MLGTEPAPTKVLENKADNYSERHIHCREEGLILYAPQNNINNKKEKSKYEIVLHKPCTESLYAYRYVFIFFLFVCEIYCYSFTVYFAQRVKKKPKRSFSFFKTNCQYLLKLPKRFVCFSRCISSHELLCGVELFV